MQREGHSEQLAPGEGWRACLPLPWAAAKGQ